MLCNFCTHKEMRKSCRSMLQHKIVFSSLATILNGSQISFEDSNVGNSVQNTYDSGWVELIMNGCVPRLVMK